MKNHLKISAILISLAVGLAGCADTPSPKKKVAQPAKTTPAKEATPTAAAKPADDTLFITSTPDGTSAPAAPASAPTAAAAGPKLEVNIADSLPSVEVKHMGETFTIMRNQSGENLINPNFIKTSRKCPPFCVQPYVLAPGVKTIGELEMLDYIKKSMTDPNILVIDSRTPDWLERGTIPGSINIPWDQINIGKSAPITVQEILTRQFGAVEREGFWDFSNAKTLVLFCNGQWCGQSPTNIKGLLRIGYPASKLVWYRGGMQEWEIMGLTTVKPAK
jgi:rhodanese-related sulfurtransferase